jgi:hypothetical protein
VQQVQRDELRHLAGAHDECAAAREVAELALDELDRDGRHRDRVARDLGLRPHALSRGGRLLKESIQDGA